MDLTARYVQGSRQCIAEVEAADITNPEMSRVALVRLVVRLTETLRTVSDHAERQGVTVDAQRVLVDALKDDVSRLSLAAALQADSEPSVA